MSAETVESPSIVFSEANRKFLERKGATEGAPIYAPNVIIHPQHQSAPKEHWVDREIQKAAEEMDKGTANLDAPDVVDEYFHAGADSLLRRHPRVQEALRRLEAEEMEQTNSQESLENQQRLWELNARLKSSEHWDGEGRWIGKENEEMRIGLILTPFQFVERLEKVIGHGKVFLPRTAVLKRCGLYTDIADERTRDCDAYDFDRLMKVGAAQARVAEADTSLLLPDGTRFDPSARKVYRVGTLQYPCGTEWMIMRFDEYGVPTEAKYLGWRTALLRLILLGIVTEKQAHKAFPLGSGPAGDWYREQLMMHRNKGVGNA